jgi:flagellar biosynthesis/type III secretory pathway protein FliH
MELNADAQARMEAESREMLRMDIECCERTAMNKGRAEGRAEGLAEGLAKGRAESREMLRMDIECCERTAMNKGLEKGRTEGLAEGLAKGLEAGQAKGLTEANRAIARKLLEREWSVDEIAAMTNLSRDEIQSLAR